MLLVLLCRIHLCKKSWSNNLIVSFFFFQFTFVNTSHYGGQMGCTCPLVDFQVIILDLFALNQLSITLLALSSSSPISAEPFLCSAMDQGCLEHPDITQRSRSSPLQLLCLSHHLIFSSIPCFKTYLQVRPGSCHLCPMLWKVWPVIITFCTSQFLWHSRVKLSVN